MYIASLPNSLCPIHVSLHLFYPRSLFFSSVPMQRLLKYPLLLKDLLKHTPQGHTEYSSIEKALDNFLVSINSESNIEAMQALLSLSLSLSLSLHVMIFYIFLQQSDR